MDPVASSRTTCKYSNTIPSNTTTMTTITTPTLPPASINGSPLKSAYDTDVVRMIGQHLINLGLRQTAELLQKESGLQSLDHPVVTKLQQYILAGDWTKANQAVEDVAIYCLGDDKQTTINQIRVLLAEQKFLELIDDNQSIKALKCLRIEITPITNDIRHIQYLASLLMCKTIDEVRSRANWPGKSLQSRQNLIAKLQRFIPPFIMLPPKRLETLLMQAVQLQREHCALHIDSRDTGLKPEHIDLKVDHLCSAENFPLSLRQELDNHKTEVWYCKFSNDGQKLATGGLGGKVKIWDLDVNKRMLNERCTLDCNSYSITCLSWSPNDVYLLACGSEERPDLWVWNVNKEEMLNMINHSDDESITTCSWHISGEKFAAASIRGNFYIYDLDCNRRGGREGVRVQCLSFLYKDPNVILAADTLNRIKSYAITDMSLETAEEDVLEERHPIMSFTVDRQDHYIAVNLVEQGIHLWDLKLKTLLRMFPGVLQRSMTIYSSFSSPDSTFLASGSEDGKVYIYNVNKEKPVAILCGHSRCVNCVTWNSEYPELLVSVSDDRTVRLWAPATIPDSPDSNSISMRSDNLDQKNGNRVTNDNHRQTSKQITILDSRK